MTTEIWGDFEVHLDRLLGRGGMGAVYVGRQISLDRPVAVKVLKKDLCDDPDFVKRFHREASLLAKLIHPHVVQVFMAGEHGGQHFFAMELVEGEDLFSALKRGHRFSPDEVLRIAYETAQALHAGWKHQIVHRDIKPSNIIVTREQQTKVMDFGLAKSPSSADLTAAEGIVGTAKYMSPEQGTGSPLDIRTDLYSLGVVLYELATGLPPFSGDNPTAIVYQHVHKEPAAPRTLNPSIPPELEAMVLKLMSKRPDDRYQAPEELARHCRTLLDRRRSEAGDTVKRLAPAPEPSPPPSAPSPEAGPPPPAARSSALALAFALLLGFAVIGAGGWYAWKKLNEDPPQPPPPAHARAAADAGRGLARIAPAPVVESTTPPVDAREEAAARLAEEALGRGDWESAEKALADLPEDKRAAFRARLERAREEQRIAKAEEAFRAKNWAALEAMLADLPEAKRAQLRSGMALAKGDEALNAGNWSDALAHYEAARRDDPDVDIADRRARALVLQGDAAFARHDWAGAIAAWKEAGRPGLKEKIDRADLELVLEGAAAESDPAKRVEVYAANLARDAARIRPLLRAAAFDHGKALMGRDWPAAARAFELAMEHEPDATGRTLLEKRKSFCEKVHLEERAEAEQQWDLAKETLLELLGGEVYEFRAKLQERLKAVDAKIAAGMTSEEKKQQERFRRHYEEARKLFDQGDWKKAHTNIEQAADPVFRRYQDAGFTKLRKLCRDAANPPPGMVYVPGGTYTIGDVGERSLNGPTWEIELAPFYIDELEVPSSDYRDFLDAIEKRGHVWCHKDEGRGITHVPERPSRDGPVVWVNWFDAYSFAAWKGKRLPTEAEFEVAAGYDFKERRRRTWPWGDDFGRGQGGSFFGLRGLDNRIVEWTASDYEAYPKSRYEDDRFGPERKILRGGFKTQPDRESLKATFRHWMLRQKAELYTGFRCAQDIPEK